MTIGKTSEGSVTGPLAFYSSLEIVESLDVRLITITLPQKNAKRKKERGKLTRLTNKPQKALFNNFAAGAVFFRAVKKVTNATAESKML